MERQYSRKVEYRGFASCVDLRCELGPRSDQSDQEADRQLQDRSRIQGASQQVGHQLPMLNAVKIPDGVDDGKTRSDLLNRFGIEIGGGLGAFKGKVWRIGLMGYGSRAANVLLFLSALEQLLAEQGYQFEHGSSIAAANAVYG